MAIFFSKKDKIINELRTALDKSYVYTINLSKKHRDEQIRSIDALYDLKFQNRNLSNKLDQFEWEVKILKQEIKDLLHYKNEYKIELKKRLNLEREKYMQTVCW